MYLCIQYTKEQLKRSNWEKPHPGVAYNPLAQSVLLQGERSRSKSSLAERDIEPISAKHWVITLNMKKGKHFLLLACLQTLKKKPQTTALYFKLCMLQKR